MKTFEKFQKSSTVYEIDEAQGFSSFVGKAMGFARKVKNIAKGAEGWVFLPKSNSVNNM